MKREITTSGAFWALFLVLGAIGLIAAAVGAIVAPTRALAACIALAAVSLLMLGSYVYRHVRDREPLPKTTPAPKASGARLTTAQFFVVEALWAIIFVAAVVAVVIASGPKRVAFGIPAVIAFAALVVLELRRRRARRDAAPSPDE